MALFTLGVQIVHLLLDNRRKSSPKIWLRVLVWCAYLTSDSVATVALGVLSSKLGEANEKSSHLDDNSKLVAFEKLDKCHCTTFEKIPPILKKQIFDRVKVKFDKHQKPTDIRQIGGVLHGYRHKDEMWSTKVEFDQIILTWHVATELCYYWDKLDESNYADDSLSILLSRYMFYLLFMYPFTLPNGIGQIRIRDTYAEAVKFFEEGPIKVQTHSNTEPEESRTVSRNPSGRRTNKVVHRSQKALQSACKMLLEANTEVEPTKVKGGRSKSVLFDGCRLATVLNKSVDIEMK
ncbi:hypothetical protein NL676_028425 [Syzygium grande]|nr:hypothetical protein NL676_028425 [Syzygium grande]